MLNTKSFLAVDFGAGSLKVAEFEINEAGGLLLKQYGLKSLGAEGAQESKRESVMLKALQELLAERGFRAKNINVCAPGFHVFSKFVKLPPVDASKVTQIIQYEAQQNVPFPLAEVVWDYQILGATPTGELEVLLVAIKADIVEGLFRVADSAGLRLQLADVSTAAMCNAFRFNYGDLEDCTMLLDIGAKTSNLLFFEKGKVYSRSINIGANSITQDFSNESKLGFTEAERLKINEGFVSLGGAYEEPENPHQAAISKIARQFMTRLHIQVNQTMQFYRGQQGGSAPARLFLSGGASIMPYTAQFFAEKLNVPVEYFNPFRNVQIDPSINLEELARVAHSLGETVGLGLRNLARCPIELNLMPESTLRWQQINQKKPYFIATVFSLVLVIVATGWLFDQLADVKTAELEKLTKEVEPLKEREAKFTAAYGDLKKQIQDADRVTDWLEGRYHWATVLTEVRQVLMKVEATTKQRLRTDTGVWIERIAVGKPEEQGLMTESPAEAGMAGPMGMPGMNPEQRRLFEQRYGLRPKLPPSDVPAPDQPAAEAPPADGGQPAAPIGAKPKKGKGETNELAVATLTFRAVNLNSVDPAANTEIAGEVLKELRASDLFDPDGTKIDKNLVLDETTGLTFSFGISLKIKRPLEL
ncbi:MAG: type IV pilus assembly protein PilM [Verrucomicrobia bacterium]|nr:type IV pilus assembly protein PilM [Verrucomicrobiota bacterium]